MDGHVLLHPLNIRLEFSSPQVARSRFEGWTSTEEKDTADTDKLDFVVIEQPPSNFVKSRGRIHLECFSPSESLGETVVQIQSPCVIDWIDLYAERYCLAEDCRAIKARMEISNNLKRCEGSEGDGVRRFTVTVRRDGDGYELEQEGLEPTMRLNRKFSRYS
jgi:hypothetical protein